MVSRLRKEINRQNHEKFLDACKKRKDPSEVEPCPTPPRGYYEGYYGNLPFPRKLLGSPHQHNNYYGQPANAPTGSLSSGTIIKSSAEVIRPWNEWKMMREHCLWVRVFDIHDRFLFNHTDPQSMSTSQMLHLCTKLVKHLNLISRTDELKAQEALGTLEETIIAQLTPPLEGQMQYHAWNLQNQEDTNPIHDVEAIAIIRQTGNGVFKGQLIDDMISTTFQLQ